MRLFRAEFCAFAVSILLAGKVTAEGFRREDSIKRVDIELDILHRTRNLRSYWHYTGNVDHVDFSAIRAMGNFSCGELKRWLMSEKHYSNDKKHALFDSLEDENECRKNPVGNFRQLAFGFGGPNSPAHKSFTPGGALTLPQCKNTAATHDKLAVLVLNNYSIKHNFSHFLHSLVRLFCALVDAGLIWVRSLFRLSLSFVASVPVSIPLSTYNVCVYLPVEAFGSMNYHL
mgnify:CR=1 FL=1